MMLARADRKSIDRNIEAGADRVVFGLLVGEAGEILPKLDELAKLIGG
jgi:hypothetical protein